MSNHFVTLINDFEKVIGNSLGMENGQELQFSFDDGILVSISPHPTDDTLAIKAKFVPDSSTNTGLKPEIAQLLLQRNDLSIADSRIMTALTAEGEIALVYTDRSHALDGQTLFEKLELVINQARSLRAHLDNFQSAPDSSQMGQFVPPQMYVIRP